MSCNFEYKLNQRGNFDKVAHLMLDFTLGYRFINLPSLAAIGTTKSVRVVKTAVDAVSIDDKPTSAYVMNLVIPA